jgi:hypothetical protein
MIAFVSALVTVVGWKTFENLDALSCGFASLNNLNQVNFMANAGGMISKRAIESLELQDVVVSITSVKPIMILSAASARSVIVTTLGF